MIATGVALLARLRAPAGAGHSIATPAAPQNHAYTSYPLQVTSVCQSSVLGGLSGPSMIVEQTGTVAP